jgi:hypothetical protein
VPVVAFDVARELRNPILFPNIWNAALVAISVLMPETTVDKDNFAPGSEYDIRLPREIFAVQPEAVTHSMY